MGFVHNQTSTLPVVDSVRPIDYSVSDRRVVSLVFVLSVIMNTPEMVFLDTHGSWWNCLGVRGLYLTVGKRSVVSRKKQLGEKWISGKKNVTTSITVGNPIDKNLLSTIDKNAN